MAVIKCSKADEISKVTIAKGKKVINSIDDRLDIKYNGARKNYNNEEVIDYKAIGTVQGVEKGQVIAILRRGKIGSDGVDIKGKALKCKNSKIVS